MKLFKSIRDFLRCSFCKKIWKNNCKSRFNIGNKIYYSGASVKTRKCPKDLLKK